MYVLQDVLFILSKFIFKNICNLYIILFILILLPYSILNDKQVMHILIAATI